MKRINFYKPTNLPKLALASSEIRDKLGLTYNGEYHNKAIEKSKDKIIDSITNFFDLHNLKVGQDILLSENIYFPEDDTWAQYCGFNVGITYKVLNIKRFVEEMNIPKEIYRKLDKLEGLTITVEEGISTVSGIETRKVKELLEDYLSLNDDCLHKDLTDKNLGVKAYHTYAIELSNLLLNKYKKLANKNEFIVYSKNKIHYKILEKRELNEEYQSFNEQLEKAKLKRELSLGLTKNKPRNLKRKI